MREILKQKKTKISLYIIAVLWVAVVVQIILNRVIQPKDGLLEAFVNTKSQISYMELEMAGYYGEEFLEESEKNELIYYIADQIGLQVDSNISIQTNEDKSEVYYKKSGKNAESLIKIISNDSNETSVKKENGASDVTTLKHYVLVRLKVYSNPDGVLELRSLLDTVFEDLRITSKQTTMEVSSTYIGKLELKEMNQIADSMIQNLDGKIAYENRSESLYTIYGYTGLLPEYITTLGSKINIHVAITYDEVENKTEVILATPMIRGSY